MVELVESMGNTHLSLEALMQYGAGYLPSCVLLNESSLEDLKQNYPDQHQATKQIRLWICVMSHQSKWNPCVDSFDVSPDGNGSANKCLIL